MQGSIITAFSLLGGFLFTRLVDHLRGREQKRDVSKSIALSLLPIAKALKKNDGFFEQALATGRDSLRGYFIAVTDVVPPTDMKDYEMRVRSDPKLEHRIIADLRATAEAIGSVARWHQQARNTVELTDEWYGDRETYRVLLKKAHRLIDQALRSLERFAPSDTKTEIRAYRNGGQ